MNSPTIFDNEQLTILNTLYQAYANGTIALSTQTITDWNASTVYNSGRYIKFEEQVFLVTITTLAGESPITRRGKFKWIGGGVNQNNTSSGSFTATLNKNSGVVVLSGGVVGLDNATFTINNNLIGNSGERSNISLKIKYNGDGAPTISYYYVGANSISILIFNSSTDATSDDIYILFNIED